jgi:hypothetical protein
VVTPTQTTTYTLTATGCGGTVTRQVTVNIGGLGGIGLGGLYDLAITDIDDDKVTGYAYISVKNKGPSWVKGHATWSCKITPQTGLMSPRNGSVSVYLDSGRESVINTYILTAECHLILKNCVATCSIKAQDFTDFNAANDSCTKLLLTDYAWQGPGPMPPLKCPGAK